MTTKIDGKKIHLAELKEEDASKLHEYSKEPKLNEYSGPYKASESLEKAKEYIEICKKNILEKKSHVLGIYENSSNDFVGTIGFFGLDEENKNGEIGFWVAKDYWNKGYMTEAVKLMTHYAFKILNYHRIYAHFHELNQAVGKILGKVGYEKEGELRQALKSNKGEFHNEIIYGIVNQ
jgi:ribosomal-protein-alanine N-acetyltransferase